MADPNNRPALRIVRENEGSPDSLELLIAAPGGKRVRIVEGDVTRPEIPSVLQSFAAMRLDPCGRHGFSLILPVLWKGSERGIDGNWGLHRFTDVTVPRGTIARWLAEAA